MEARDIEIMTQQIMRGVEKEQSTLTMDQETSETWDALANEIKQIRAEGFIVEIPFETAGMQPLDPNMIVESVD